MGISVSLMDGSTISLPIDSASTSQEICKVLSQKIKLHDIFGFSLYMALYDKVRLKGTAENYLSLPCYLLVFQIMMECSALAESH